MCAGVSARAYCARVRTIVRLLGREMEKWGGMRKKVGEGGEGRGMRDGRGVDPEMKVE